MNVLSLFNGMGCIWIALDRLGVKVNRRYCSEIDKFANKVNDANYPDSIQLGDVRNIKASDLEKIDLICGGSPCQGFSFAGKMLNFKDPRSALFFEFVRLLGECRAKNPNVLFLLENVEMRKKYENEITKILGVNPVKINSALVSAQKRERLYWTNIGQQPDGFFGEMKTRIAQPKDKRVFLRHILQPLNLVSKKHYLTPAALSRIERGTFSIPKINPEKAGTLNTKNNSGQLSYDSGTTIVAGDFVRIDIRGNAKKNQSKAYCLTADGNSGGNHSDMDVIFQRGRGYNEGGEFVEKSPPLTSNSWEHNHTLKQVRQLNRSLESAGKQPYQQNRIYDINGISPELCANLTVGSHAITDGEIYRRLTVVECCRLQTVPDDYFLDNEGNQIVSDTQAYRQLGNGWTVDVIVHILSFANF